MIDLRTLKKHLKVDTDQTVDDDLIVEMEQEAVAYMQNETGRYYGPLVEFTEILSPRGWAPLWLQGIPVVDDDYLEFTLERRATSLEAWGAVESTEYELDGQRLIPTVFWRAAERTLRATYWAGYAENDEPADVRGAVRQLVTRMYQQRLPAVVEVDDTVRQVVRAQKIVIV